MENYSRFTYISTRSAYSLSFTLVYIVSLNAQISFAMFHVDFLWLCIWIMLYMAGPHVLLADESSWLNVVQ